MDIVDWRFIYIILTFAVMGIFCSFKKFKAGVLAASTGIFATLIVWGCRVVVLKIKSYFSGDGLAFKEIGSVLTCVIVSVIAFTLLALIFEAFNNKKRRRRKR